MRTFLTPLILTTAFSLHAAAQEGTPAASKSREAEESPSSSRQRTRTTRKSKPSESGGSQTEREPEEARTAAQEKADRELYEKGNGSYVRGDYEDALRHFSELHRRTKHPALLFNMAQAHRLSGAGHCLEAKRLYESYLHEDPNVPNEDEVRERLAQLKACAKEEERELEKAATKAAPKPKPAPTLSKVFTISGAVLLAAGGGILAASRIRFAQVKDECPCEQGRFSAWEGFQNASYAMMALGAASAVGGGTWWLSASPRVDQASDSGFQIGLHGSF